MFLGLPLLPQRLPPASAWAEDFWAPPRREGSFRFTQNVRPGRDGLGGKVLLAESLRASPAVLFVEGLELRREELTRGSGPRGLGRLRHRSARKKGGSKQGTAKNSGQLASAPWEVWAASLFQTPGSFKDTVPLHHQGQKETEHGLRTSHADPF